MKIEELKKIVFSYTNEHGEVKIKKTNNNIKDEKYKIYTLYSDKSFFRINVVLNHDEITNVGISPNFSSVIKQKNYTEIFNTEYFSKQFKGKYSFYNSNFDNKKNYIEVDFDKGVIVTLKDLISTLMYNSFEENLVKLSNKYLGNESIRCELLINRIEKIDKDYYIVKGSIIDELTEKIDREYYTPLTSVFFDSDFDINEYEANIKNYKDDNLKKLGDLENMNVIPKKWKDMSPSILNSLHTLHPYFLYVEFKIKTSEAQLEEGSRYLIDMKTHNYGDEFACILTLGCSPLTNVDGYISIVNSVNDLGFSLIDTYSLNYITNDLDGIDPIQQQNQPPLFNGSNIVALNVYSVGNALTTILEDDQGGKYIYDIGKRASKCHDTIYSNKVSDRAINGVIISHWHVDHFNGLSLLSDNSLYTKKWLIRKYKLGTSKSSRNVISVLFTIQKIAGNTSDIMMIKKISNPSNPFFDIRIFNNFDACIYDNPGNANDSSICLSNKNYTHNEKWFLAGDLNFNTLDTGYINYITNLNFLLVPHHGSEHNNVGYATFSNSGTKIACISCNGTGRKAHPNVVSHLVQIVNQLDLTSNIACCSGCLNLACTNWYYRYEL